MGVGLGVPPAPIRLPIRSVPLTPELPLWDGRDHILREDKELYRCAPSVVPLLRELGVLGLMLGLEGACLGEGVLIERRDGLTEGDRLRLSDGLEGLDRDGRLEPIDGLGRGVGLRDGMLRPGEMDRLPMDGMLRPGEMDRLPMDGRLRRVETEKPLRWVEEGGRLMGLRELEDRLRLESLPSAELRLLSDGAERTCGVLGRLGARADRIADRREAELLREDLAPSTEEATSKAAPTATAMILAR